MFLPQPEATRTVGDKIGHPICYGTIGDKIGRIICYRTIGDNIVDPGSAVPRKSNHVSESREAGDLNVTNDGDVDGQIGNQIPSELVGNQYAVLFTSDGD